MINLQFTSQRFEIIRIEPESTDSSRRIRYDTMATVIEVDDDGEYRPLSRNDDIDPVTRSKSTLAKVGQKIRVQYN